MTNEQANEMLALMAEMIIEQRRFNDKIEALEKRLDSRIEGVEKELRYYADVTKMVLKSHESRLSALEHE